MTGELPLDQVDSNALFGEPGKNLQAKKVVMANNGRLDDDSVCEVKFCTGGRLSAPEILHFYDYNMLSAQLIAELSAKENHMPTIIKILNTMVVEENFDCGQLHIEEIKEVLLNVHAKWWSPTLHEFPYYLNPELEDKELTAKENIAYAELPIANLVIKPLPEEIREPINITIGKTSVQFVYPRAQNGVIADAEMKKKFAVQEQQYFHVKKALKEKRGETIPLAELEAYNEYTAERADYKLLLLRAQYICGVNHEVLETLEERIEALTNNKSISLRHFEKYNSFLENEGAFGLQDEVKFYSDVLDKEVLRPFRFRTYTLILSVGAKRSNPAKISFG